MEAMPKQVVVSWLVHVEDPASNLALLVVDTPRIKLLQDRPYRVTEVLRNHGEIKVFKDTGREDSLRLEFLPALRPGEVFNLRASNRDSLIEIIKCLVRWKNAAVIPGSCLPQNHIVEEYRALDSTIWVGHTNIVISQSRATSNSTRKIACSDIIDVSFDDEAVLLKVSLVHGECITSRFSERIKAARLVSHLAFLLSSKPPQKKVCERGARGQGR